MINVVADRIGQAFVERFELVGAFDGFESQLFGSGKSPRSEVGGFHRFVVRPCFGRGLRAEEEPFAPAVLFPTVYNPLRCGRMRMVPDF